MNFIKLIPILFLAHTPVSDGRPTALQLLPEVPGYIPVYIQTGNEPPDVKSMILSMGKSVPKRETMIDPLKGEGQPEVPKDPFVQHGDKGPEKLSDHEKKDEASNDPLTPIKVEDKKPEKETIVEKKSESKKPIGQIREIAHYEVKEPAQE